MVEEELLPSHFRFLPLQPTRSLPYSFSFTGMVCKNLCPLFSPVYTQLLPSADPAACRLMVINTVFSLCSFPGFYILFIFN